MQTLRVRLTGVRPAAERRQASLRSVAHFEAELLADNLVRVAQALPPEPTSDGHATCFVETGGEQLVPQVKDPEHDLR